METYERNANHQKEDSELYGCSARIEPITRMTTDESGELVHLLSNMPIGAGFIITRINDPIGAPQTFGGTSATVVLPGNWSGAAWDNNPARAFRRAWARAHEAAATALMPKEMD